jgi:hypothetical protein
LLSALGVPSLGHRPVVRRLLQILCHVFDANIGGASGFLQTLHGHVALIAVVLIVLSTSA